MNTSRVKIFAAMAVLTALAIAAAWIPPARAAIEAAMSCAKSTPCLEWDNTSGGNAIKGVSTSGNALHGQTEFKSAGKTSDFNFSQAAGSRKKLVTPIKSSLKSRLTS